MRILIVSCPYPPQVVGGAEIVAARQAAGLAARGHDVNVFAGSWGGGLNLEPGALELEDYDAVKVWRVGVARPAPAVRTVEHGVRNRLESVLEYFKPDIVHIHNIAGLGFDVLPVAASTGARVVLTLHDPWGFCFNQTLLRPSGAPCDNLEECAVCSPVVGSSLLPQRVRRDTVLSLLLHADWFVVPGAGLASSYIAAGLSAPQVRVISNGIDLESIGTRRVVPETPEFLFVGYLGLHKGISDLLDAAAILAHRIPDHSWHLSIVGSGDMADWAAEEVSRRGLSHRVAFLGRLKRKEVVAALQRSTALVMPSRWPENEPVVILEALAAGLPQIATDVAGNRTLVEDGVTGLLVPRANPPALARAMQHLLDHPEIVAEMSARNLERRAANDSESAVERLLELYTSLPPANDRMARTVLCAGSAVPAAVNRSLAIAYQSEDNHSRTRFISSDFASPAQWHSAQAIWIWSEADPGPVLGEALRRRIRIVAPADAEWARTLSERFGVCEIYRSAPEAITLLRAAHSILPPSKELFELAATWRTKTAPEASYSLLVEA